uniref:BUB1 N-terminal domain-containing protein n=1 Tax=Fundulus heteroclitus TaxID=8078 RepID=A0A3Q2PE33_FUNHE
MPLYAQVFSKGVGTRTAALYVAWAQQLERAGGNQAADAVYQKALENRAQPADVVLHEYNPSKLVLVQKPVGWTWNVTGV